MSTLIVACGDHPPLPRVEGAVVFDDLCASPEQLGGLEIEAERAVLLLHRGEYELGSVQTALRVLGIDPLGAEVIEREELGEGAAVVIAGALARAKAYPGSLPEHARPAFPRTFTRRSFLKMPAPEYVAVPYVDVDICAAMDGCRACVDACPRDAYRWHQGGILYDKDACEPCGICVTTCPTGAISNPVVAGVSLRAQIEALVTASEAPVGIRYVCSRGVSGPAPGWFDVRVPCTGMVPGTWLLAALLLGAGATTAMRCDDSGCPLGLSSGSENAVAMARAALGWAGRDPEHVPTGPGAAPATAWPPAALDDPFGAHGPVAVMLALDAAATEPLMHAAARIGIVAIDAETCTLCTKCAQTCPTGALGHGYEGDTVSVTFDGARCTACRQCVLVCPELARGAIRVDAGVDVDQLRSGRRTLNEGPAMLCEVCGKPIAPSAMMDRIGNLLGADHAATMSYLSRRCMECRGIA